MRTPMSDADASDGRPDADRAGDGPAGEGVGTGPQPRDGGQEGETPAGKPAREKSGSDWFAPRKPVPSAPADGGGEPVAGPGPASGPGAGYGDDPVAAGSASVPPRADLPYRSGGGAPQREPSALDAYGVDGPGGPRATPDTGGPTPAPSGPTTGPVGGSSSLTPDLDKIARTTGGPGEPSGPAGPRPGGAAGPEGPFGPGGMAPRLSDDTAILTPQAGLPARGPVGQVSGDTLTGGIPAVPPDTRPPFPGGPGVPSFPDGPGKQSAEIPAEPAPKATAPAKKGRSKLVLLCVAVFVLFGIAYGAGLLMNHSEVPKGTTVLGVDIGGGTKEEAVTKLEATFGKRAQSPLTLSVDGKEQKLDPEKAGLVLDSQATVRGAAGSDYNPVSVIGSLFGGARPADPVIPVDEEKLGVALADLAGGSGSANDGTIRFEPDKAVPVPGKSGKALDVNRSMISVRDAYRTQVETGKPAVVELPVATTEPTIDQAELDRAMKEFAEPAMSGLITIKAGPKQIDFGPARSLPEILSMKPVDGRLVEVYDKKAIDTLLDGVFDGIMITKGDGQQHEVGADDVAHAMRSALLGKTPAERTVTIDLGGEG
ncbi:hypothetical protein OG909_21570 [Streptomyces sp. NBC_01754]|nr:hypothetical protein [Streptomyces sp. NBC_01754]WSC94656.1 hypothetical protein OG909_21570 [Streptomyces sp. NBC_01754]